MFGTHMTFSREKNVSIEGLIINGVILGAMVMGISFGIVRKKHES